MAELQHHFGEIAGLIQTSRANALLAVNAELVNLYWNVGAYISHKLSQSEWGDKTVSELAKYLKQNEPNLKGFDRRGLYRMVQFYETYALEEFVSPVVTQLKPSPNVSPLVTQLDTGSKTGITPPMIEQFVPMDIRQTILGKTQLSPALQEFNQEVGQGFKDSYIFDFLNLPDSHNESDLQKGLVAQMKNFILELGKDFLFMGQEYKLQVGNSDFFIDLLFYHRGLQCLVAFELKADKFRPEHLGQLNFYLEALDRDVKRENENPSIGILLCKDKDNEVVEYALNCNLSPAMVAEYQVLLPQKELLQRKLQELEI